MLARLQRFTTLVWLAALAGWLAWQLRLGHTTAAWLGAIVLACPHALWLAVGFVVARRANWSDPAPRASARQVLRAWWGEALAAPRVFCWQQPFRSRAVPDHLPPDAAGKAGVLLVHGYVCNRGFWNPWMRRLRAEGVPFVAINLEPVFGGIDDYTPLIEAAMQRLETATGQPPLLVGHSMGGLAIRAWLGAHDADARVRGVVTLGSPHHGTLLAQAAFTPNGLQMRPGSTWLRKLAASENASRRRLFLCCFGHCDNVVFPASSACLPGSEVHHLPATGHVDLVHHPWPLAEVLRRVG